MIGHVAALASSVLWAVASILFTRLRGDLSAGTLNLLKTGIAAALMMVTLAAMTGNALPTGFSQSEVVWLSLSGLIGLTIGDTLLFEAFGRIGPRRALLFLTLSPAITALLAWPILDEPIYLMMAVGITLTIVGVSMVVNERNSERSHGVDMVGYLFAGGSALCQAVGNIFTKLGGEHDPLSMSVIRTGVGALALLIYLAIKHDLLTELLPMKRRAVWLTVLIATIIGTYLGIWLQVTGLRYAPAGIAATLSSTSPLFVLPLAAIFLRDRLSWRGAVAATIAVLGISVLFM